MSKNKAEQRLFPHIPDDILINILEKLSLKSLAKATIVSRHWDCLIYNSLDLTKPKILFTSNDFVFDAPFLLSSIDTQSRVEKVSPPDFILSKPSKRCLVYSNTRNMKLNFSGSCNGLVLVEARDSFYLWNPLTKYTEEVTLPVMPWRDFPNKLVLGLCHVNNNYKVVVAARNHHMLYVRVYVSLVSSMPVSFITVDFDYHLNTLRSGSVLNGCLHSLASKINQNGREYIVAFYPRVNLFSDVAMPNPRAENGDLVLGLGVLGRCLCLARLESPLVKNSNIEILIMKEYNVASSWAVTCSIINFDSFGYIRTLVPLCYNNDGHAMVHVNGQHIKSLNINENFIAEIGGVSNHYQYKAIFYEENWG